MATAELPITRDYLPTWGVWEGLREIVQNGLDESVQNSSPMEIESDGMAMTIRNVGSILDPKAFLFGHTTKADDARTVGQYGEGLKLGILALVRAGKKIEIVVGRDVWKARFLNSRKYGAKILAFDIQKDAYEEDQDVAVTIEPVEDGEREMIQKRILSLNSNRPEMVGTDAYYGSLITDEAYRGRIFVKGIWVCDKEDMEFGYDFHSVDLNRDRDFVRGWDIGYAAANIVNGLLNGEGLPESIVKRIYKVMTTGEGDEADGFASYLSLDAKKVLADVFRREHGENAVPVADSNGVRQAEFAGMAGVVVPRTMAQALAAVPGMAVKDRAAEVEIEKLYPLDELTVAEREKLATACLLVGEARTESGRSYVEIRADDLNIVDFSRETTLGLFQYGKISIARKVLDRSLDEVLQVVVHEVLHFLGDDGTRSHSEAQSELLCKIVTALWDKPLN